MGKKDSAKAAGKTTSKAAAKTKSALRLLRKAQSKRVPGTPIDLRPGDAKKRVEREEKGYLRCSARLTAEQLQFWHDAGGSAWTRRILEEGIRMKEAAARKEAPLEKPEE
ncbi:hypothetical protein [uncultured Sutterella sp.]|uniref:hypothetical protein n=1 Tax=uncultured Sutterella sp. TaxID=286133 RepID=UPI002627AC1F|nr:hypothetical protein [uncultured Sutterella sp.]